ncbi:MAG: glycosyltransferase family 4 protein [Patescibacteria group bacterium]
MIQIKHIAIDGNEANVTNRVGSNIFAYQILKNLELLTQKRRDLHFTILLSSPPITDMPEQRQHWRYRVVTPKPFWTQWALPLHLFLNRNRYNVFFTPGHYAPRYSAVPYISSVMDLAFLKYPEQFKTNDLIQLKNWTAYSVRAAKKVITISQYTKDEVLATYNKRPDEVEVVYPSIEQSPGTSQTKSRLFFKKNKITQPYILYLGTIQPRKNLVNLIKAFEIFVQGQAFSQVKTRRSQKKAQSFEQPKLVIAGKIGWLAEEVLQTVEKSPFKKQIILTGYVPENLKTDLYKNAKCSVLIGLHEGFGIPPLESLTNQTIPIVSNSTSLPEVVGSAGILVDPSQPEKIADAFKKVWRLSNKEIAIYRKQAREQVARFSWQTSAAKVLELLESI